jgi:hypothetical protein
MVKNLYYITHAVYIQFLMKKMRRKKIIHLKNLIIFLTETGMHFL